MCASVFGFYAPLSPWAAAMRLGEQHSRDGWMEDRWMDGWRFNRSHLQASFLIFVYEKQKPRILQPSNDWSIQRRHHHSNTHTDFHFQHEAHCRKESCSTNVAMIVTCTVVMVGYIVTWPVLCMHTLPINCRTKAVILQRMCCTGLCVGI